MYGALLLLAQGRGDDPDGGIGVLVIVGSILLMAAVIGAVAALMIRRSRRGEGRTGPVEEPHDPGHGGRVSSMEPDRARR